MARKAAHRVLMKCGYCGDPFEIAQSLASRGRGRFCDNWCRLEALKYRNSNAGLDSPEPFDQMRERFWSHVRKGDGCWIFGTGLTHDHQKFYRRKVDGGHLGAHVFSYLIHFGPIPRGHVVRHTCDVGACVRPDHLIPGSHRDNSRDMVKRGRVALHRAKLSLEQAEEIRRRYNSGERQDSLAVAFGVRQTTISAIVTGKTWTNLSLTRRVTG